MKNLLIVLLLSSSQILTAQHPDMPDFTSRDIGSPAIAGSTSYDEDTQVYTLKGSGYNIWFERDEFHFSSVEMTGDFIATANFAFEGRGTDPHRKTGWMMRTDDSDNAVHASAVVHGDGLTLFQWRPEKGAGMRDPEDQAFAPKSHYSIVQLERSGNTMIMRAAIPGEPLQLIGSHTFPGLAEKVNLGLFMCSHNPEVVESARAWNVRIVKPVPDDYNAGESGYLQSRLETMNVFTGQRKILHTYESRFEAPNWLPDGNGLLFNQDGKIYTIDLTGENLKQLSTGIADRNNNDHGISFDGKLLAISHHRSGLPGGGSSVYVLPVEGGEPRLVTENTPSYWHGWDPDNEHVVYVAQRNTDNYDIYRGNITTGEEERLSDYAGAHADGPEYTPDGEYIYYNASPTGTMQIWRMKPDGSDKEQVTFDEYNDWFPHISPDGRWIAFLSFMPTINPGDHPAYKRVMLRLMPVEGGPIRVIAYVFGGQGTINVPSWSPDSRHISFVSYTK